MEEYQLPQITIGARKKGQLYLDDLSNVMIWVRYNTCTQHRHAHTQCKQGQKSQEYQSKKERKARRIISVLRHSATRDGIDDATKFSEISIRDSSVHIAPCFNKTRTIFIKQQERFNRNV